MAVPNSHAHTNIPGAVLNAALFPGKLNICHGNAQSLCARKFLKLEEVRHLLSGSKIDIACFTESWLNTKRTDRCITVPGYSVVRNDREYSRGGGIVVYHRKHLSCMEVYRTKLTASSTDKTECLALDFTVNSQHVLVVVVYNPPDNDCSVFLEEKLAVFSVRYEDILLIGDFNTDLLSPSSRQSRFLSVLRNFSLTSACDEPTHFTANGCSQLDLLISNDINKVLRFGQVSFPGLSAHDLIFASLDIDSTQHPKTVHYRDYVHFNAEALRDAILAIPWDVFLQHHES